MKAIQTQLIHSEKMASLGVVSAGIGHEINNPLSFISSSLTILQEYIQQLFQITDAYERRSMEKHRVIGSLLGKNLLNYIYSSSCFTFIAAFRFY